jgi:hypothetical protein
MVQSSKSTLFEELRNMLRDALQDIRHKVVEEPWFGRETTKDAPAHMNMQHNHEHTHQHEHNHSHPNVVENKAQQTQHQDLYGKGENYDKQQGIEGRSQLDGDVGGSSAQTTSPYIKDGLPATFDEYLTKHHGMGGDKEPEQVQGVEMAQEQAQHQERER